MEGDNITVEQAPQVQPPAAETSQTLGTGAAQAPASAETRIAREPRRSRRADAPGIETLTPGTQVKGRVRNVVEFGAFIDVGVNRDGLAHISVLKQAGIDKTIKTGDVIDVVIRRIETDSNRISLTLPGVEQAEPESRPALKGLDKGQLMTGKVVRLADFGAFVDIDAGTDGLLHVSQLSSDFVRHPSEVLKVGQEVQVRVLEVDQRRRRISLTMKEVSEDDAAEMPVSDEPQERMPTAFELAFQEAVKRQRRTRK
ncbi:MAG: S1 RNA-binding domain-containing protein [Chloroflexi bacterium]|nr:S1 RNA-binding domain-containing protein [Chloroflexota bacterium]